MNKAIIIVGALAVFLIIIGGAVYFLAPKPAAPVGGQQVPATNNSPSIPASNSAQSTAAVQEAYRSELAKHPSDNTKLYQTDIVGEYALQVYAGDILGGAALLKYDQNKDQWILVDGGGGTWDVNDLVAVGVPRATATALLAGISQ